MFSELISSKVAIYTLLLNLQLKFRRLPTAVMNFLHCYVVAMVTVFGVQRITCDDEGPEPLQPPNGTVFIPQAMAMDDFRAHVCIMTRC